MATITLSADDRRAIAEAVGRAEEATSGEIVCVLAPEADDYAEVPVAWAAALAFVAPLAALLAGWRPAFRLPWLHTWEAGRAALDVQLVETLAAYLTVQAVLFGLVFAALQVPALRRAATPGGLKAAKVRKGAASQFLATGLSSAPDRTGVLIYASMGDRRVEVIADRLIHDKVGEAAWREAVQAVQAGMKGGVTGGGFVRAVEVCGAALATHFPAVGPRANAFSDELREL